MQNITHKIKKGEDEQAYKKDAKSGMALMFPVSVGNQTHRPDIKMPYHSSIKVFDIDKDNPKEAHNIANQLDLNTPDPKKVMIEPDIFPSKDKNYDVHVLKLRGPHSDTIKQHHGKFGHMGRKDKFEYQPHVAVDKETWHRIKNSGAKTAHEAGIKFHPAALMQGDKVLAVYPGKKITDIEKAELEKATWKHLGAALGTAAALSAAPTMTSTTKPPTQKAVVHQESPYSSQRMLSAIKQVESAGGKLQHHKLITHGINEGQSAYGEYALTPNVIKETVHMNRGLRSKYGPVMRLQGQELHNYLKDHPNAQTEIAQSHLQRLEHHFGRNPSSIGYAWLNGISGTYHAKKQNKDINNHWYVQRINNAYSKGK